MKMTARQDYPFSEAQQELQAEYERFMRFNYYLYFLLLFFLLIAWLLASATMPPGQQKRQDLPPDSYVPFIG